MTKFILFFFALLLVGCAQVHAKSDQPCEPNFEKLEDRFKIYVLECMPEKFDYPAGGLPVEVHNRSDGSVIVERGQVSWTILENQGKDIPQNGDQIIVRH